MAEEDEGLLSMTTSSANLTVNPFETASLDSMHLPAFSPSVFTSSQETPCSKKKSSFRWSIDQMSLLFPADIDELPQQQDASFLPKEKEDQVQEAINQFFSQKVVVPSPWSESKPMKHVTFSPKPPSVSVLSEHSAENSMCSSNGSFLGSLSGKVDVSCQTAITLPMNFDLEALLGKGRFVYTKTSVESFPVAPLRRKLFTQSESSSNVSPLSASNRESGPFSPSISPIKSSQESSPVGEEGQIARTPNSVESQFSSSPIARFRTTPLRPVPHLQYQASPLVGKMESPLMSPIREAPNDIGLPPSPIPHSTSDPLETGNHISPVIIKGSSLYKQPRPSEHRMDTSLSKEAIQEFRPQMADIGIGGNDEEPVCERVDFLPERQVDGRHKIDAEGGEYRSDAFAGRVVSVFDTSGVQGGGMIEAFDPSGRSHEVEQGSMEGFDESDGGAELGMEGRKDFTLGLTRELSPIQKIGDPISMMEEPGCSSRLQGTQEESSMDTSLMNNRGVLRENIHASSPPIDNIPCNFSLETSTALSPIPKTGNLSQFSPVHTGQGDDTKDRIEARASRPKGRHKMVSFHIGTEFSPIRCVESAGEHIPGGAMPITSSRVHESNTELLMETSLFSLDGGDERDRSERVENIGADDGREFMKPLTSSQRGDVWHASALPQTHPEVIENGANVESNDDGRLQQFVQTSPKNPMDSECTNQQCSHEKDTECLSVAVADSATPQHLSTKSNMFMRTSSVRDGATSACKSCGSCDHTGACWVSDSNPPSAKRGTNLADHWNAVRSPLAPAMRLTSTLRCGTPYTNLRFGQLSRYNQSATPSMNFSSVSLIANASSTKEDIADSREVDRSSNAMDEQVQTSTGDERFNRVPSEDRVEDCQMQTSFKKSPPGGMITSRSYDSLRKYVEEKENMSAQDDWLMTSLSEADLQTHRTSDMQDFVPTDPNNAASALPFQQDEHDISMQEGTNSHRIIQRSASDPLHSEESDIPHIRAAYSLKDMQEGSMSANFQTHIHRALGDSGKALGLPHQIHGNAQNCDYSRADAKKDLTPLKPISVNLLSHVVKTGVDSGYNTNSANVSMDIMELENGS